MTSGMTVATLESLLDAESMELYLTSVALGGLALLTLLLAALGVYGVVGFTVANRTREIGVRMALGASRRRVLGTVLSDGAKLALPGLAGGLVLAALVAPWVLMQWYNYIGIATVDLVVFGAAAGAALTVVLLASIMPARRAASVQPIEALRSE